jgi:hypothetical protein
MYLETTFTKMKFVNSRTLPWDCTCGEDGKRMNAYRILTRKPLDKRSLRSSIKDAAE